MRKERAAISENIRRLRQALGLTQEEFARHLDYSVVTIARWETSRPPRGRALAELARIARFAKLPEFDDAFSAALRPVPEPEVIPPEPPKEMPDDGRLTWKVKEAAKILGCGERAIRDFIDEGRIPHLMVGRNILIPRAAFRAWVESETRRG